jgi:atypical dual specificity phosphatase
VALESLNRIKAQLIFYPTLGWNMLLGRVLGIRNWWDRIDEHVVLGAMPFARDVKKMSEQENVKAVVNTCEEYNGPVNQYQEFGIDQFRMPTIDFTHPAYEDVCQAVEFVQDHAQQGHSVYIHCKAGRARSATVAICWLMKYKGMSCEAAQAFLIEKRPHVNAQLTTRPVVQRFAKEVG